MIKISGDDLTAAFYLFQLPPTWHPLFAFERPCRRCDLFEGSVDTSQVWLAATVMPMGWLSAVGILQHAHRQLAVKLGRDRLPAKAEIQRDAPLPAHGVEGCSQLWHLYLDDSTFLQWLREDSTPEILQFQPHCNQRYEALMLNMISLLLRTRALKGKIELSAWGWNLMESAGLWVSQLRSVWRFFSCPCTS